MRRILLGLVLATVGFNAQAATLVGDDVTFTFDDSTLFGGATVVGNSINFNPTAFKATSNNFDGSVSVSETLNITITVNDGSSFVITDFALVELGDYILQGTSSSAFANGRLQVSSNTQTCGFFACVDSELFSAGPLTTVGTLTDWDANATVDLTNTAGWDSDTSVIAQIQNNLGATSTLLGDSAMVQKKFGGVGLIVINTVPVPAAAWLFASALGLLGWMRRKPV